MTTAHDQVDQPGGTDFRHWWQRVTRPDIWCGWLIVVAPMAIYGRRLLVWAVGLLALLHLANMLFRRDWHLRCPRVLFLTLLAAIGWAGATVLWSIEDDRSTHVFVSFVATVTVIFILVGAAERIGVDGP